MKIKFFTMMFLMVAFAFSSFATNPISPDAFDFEKTIKVEKKMTKATKMLTKLAQSKAGKWLMKKATQVNKIAARLGVDFSDPVMKWLYYAIIGVVAGTVLWTVGAFSFYPLTYIAGLIYLGGIICFWYWVYLKFLA